MCVGVCNKPATNPFCFYEDVCLGRGNDSCSATDEREGVGGVRGGGREGGEKERVEYLAYLTCRPRCCSVQQLRNEGVRLVKTENVSLGREVSKKEKDRKQACFGSDQPGSARLL